jgi:hypothetical protein
MLSIQANESATEYELSSRGWNLRGSSRGAELSLVRGKRSAAPHPHLYVLQCVSRRYGMDPLSITAGVLILLMFSVKVSFLLKQLPNEVDIVDATLTGLLGDIASFQQVLESMRATFDQEEIKANIQITSHAGNHWKNLARPLDDGTRTLQQLTALLEGVSETTQSLKGLMNVTAKRSLRCSASCSHYLILSR